MHKWLLLIVPATDREEAINEAERFMDANTGIEVFDHYSLWGRRAEVLKPVETFDNPEEVKHFLSWVKIENPDTQKIALKRRELGYESTPPTLTLTAGQSLTIEETDKRRVAMPYEECQDVVKEWLTFRDKKLTDSRASLMEDPDRSLAGYHAIKRWNIKQEYFSFDTDVYDVDRWWANHVPDTTEDYWVVVVDMHN